MKLKPVRKIDGWMIKFVYNAKQNELLINIYGRIIDNSNSN